METIYGHHCLSKLFFFLQVELKKICCWNCWLRLCKRPNQQIKLHTTIWQYPIINYLGQEMLCLIKPFVSLGQKNSGNSTTDSELSNSYRIFLSGTQSPEKRKLQIKIHRLRWAQWNLSSFEFQNDFLMS